MRQTLFSMVAAVCCAIIPSYCLADPCGMVPPVFVDANDTNSPLKRAGAQMTYLFYADGVSTMVLRPGFEGTVDEFGMLIPFPSPPELRKVSEDIFAHLAAAADPPEVVVDVTPIPRGGGFGGGFGGGGFGGAGGGGFQGGTLGFELKVDEVRVVREEAVGSYEVAVLEAGSAKALERWMADHAYHYPKGMNEPVNDYVADRWCFVAIKARVGDAEMVDPKPGQREVSNALPAGSKFDGHVQAMQFRFRSKKMVVPMRLSAYNPGELRNVVYVLTNGSAKIRRIPEEYVVRQISGRDLIGNLDSPLPIRLIGGTKDDLRRLPLSRRRNIAIKRNPWHVNGLAAELFASDISAAESGDLLSQHELKDKALSDIHWRLGLKGEEADELIDRVTANKVAKNVDLNLRKLRHFTLTIVDGDFPRDVIASENLTFQRYVMLRSRNNSRSYDPKMLGPADKQPGLRVIGKVDWLPAQTEATQVVARQSNAFRYAWLAIAVFMVGLVWLRNLRKKIVGKR